jgi:hypothetical protein
MLSTVTYAENPEPVVVGVEFVAPISIDEVTNLEFGLVDIGMLVGETIVIAPAGGVIDSDGNLVGAVPRTAATFDTQAPANKSITVQVTPVSDGAFYDLTLWTCDYNGASEGDCGTGISVTSVEGGAVVRVGVTLTGVGGATETVDDGLFNLTITYN